MLSIGGERNGLQRQSVITADRWDIDGMSGLYCKPLSYTGGAEHLSPLLSVSIMYCAFTLWRLKCRNTFTVESTVVRRLLVILFICILYCCWPLSAPDYAMLVNVGPSVCPSSVVCLLFRPISRFILEMIQDVVSDRFVGHLEIIQVKWQNSRTIKHKRT